MKLSVAFWDGVYPGNPDPAIARADTLGIRGLVLVAAEEGWTEDDLAKGRTAFAANDMFVTEVAIRGYHLLVHADADVRRGGIANIKNQIAQARD